MTDQVRAHVDDQLCLGTGACEATVPDVFHVGSDGICQVALDAVLPELVDTLR